MLVILLLLFGESTQAYQTGAPSTACSTLTPNHGAPPQSSTSPYSLDLSSFLLGSDGNYYYEPGNTYQCKKPFPLNNYIVLSMCNYDSYKLLQA